MPFLVADYLEIDKLFNYFFSSVHHSFSAKTSVIIVELYFCQNNQPPEVFCKKDVLRNFTNTCARVSFIIKLQNWALQLFLKKKCRHRCFPVNFVKFLKTAFSQNTSGQLLLSKLPCAIILAIKIINSCQWLLKILTIINNKSWKKSLTIELVTQGEIFYFSTVLVPRKQKIKVETST